MSAPTLFAVERACKNSGSIRSIAYFDPSNLAALPGTLVDGIYNTNPTFNDSNEVYRIDFIRGSAEFREEMKNDNEQGAYFDQQLVLSVGRGRHDMEVLLHRLKNRKTHFVYTDANGMQRYVWNMILDSRYTTGRELRDKNKYDLTLRTQSRRKSLIITDSIIPVTATGAGYTIPSGTTEFNSNTFNVSVTADQATGYVITLPNAPISEHLTWVSHNNTQLILNVDYTVSGADIIIQYPIRASVARPDIFSIKYFYSV